MKPFWHIWRQSNWGMHPRISPVLQVGDAPLQLVRLGNFVAILKLKRVAKNSRPKKTHFWQNTYSGKNAYFAGILSFLPGGTSIFLEIQGTGGITMSRLNGKYDPNFDPSLLSKQPAAVSKASVDTRAEIPVQMPKKRRGRKGKAENASVVYIRDFPRDLLNEVKLMFPGLDSQTDVMIAFALWQMGPNVELPTYSPPAYIEQAVRRIREVSDTGGVEALGANMAQLRAKLNMMSDQILRQQMLLTYLITVSAGLHAPGRVHSGDDLKLMHEHVLSTTYAALGDFPQYKQIVTDHEGRLWRDAAQKKAKFNHG